MHAAAKLDGGVREYFAEAEMDGFILGIDMAKFNSVFL